VKLLVFYFSLLFTLTSALPVPVTSPYQLAALRRHYEQAASDEAAGEKFYQLMISYNQHDPVVLGYKGAAEAIKARDAAFLEKLGYVHAAAQTFEQAVALNPKNPEIRYLRFSVETNLPGFLGMSKHVEEDRQVLVASLLKHPGSGIDAEVFKTIRYYLVKHGHVNPAEAEKLEKIKA
jgi:hypothetical protein